MDPHPRPSSDLSAPRPPTDPSALLTRLEGQEVTIRGLPSIVDGWPVGVNRNYQKLRSHVEVRAKEIFQCAHVMSRIRDADPAKLVSMCWPDVSFRKLRILCYLVIWQGISDDTTEAMDETDPDGSARLRRTMKSLIDRSLVLEGGEEPPPAGTAQPPMARVTAVLADAVRAEYDGKQCSRLRDCLHEYINATAEEKTMIDAGSVPRWVDYCELRSRLGGVGTFLGMLEFAAGGSLPEGFYESSEYKTATRSLNVLVSLTNDLLSLKKEIKAGTVLNAVPVLYNVHGDMDLAVAAVVGRIREAAEALRQTLGALTACYAAAEKSQETARVVGQVVANIKHIATGNYTWSLECKRYDMGRHMDHPGGVLRFRLERVGEE